MATLIPSRTAKYRLIAHLQHVVTRKTVQQTKDIEIPIPLGMQEPRPGRVRVRLLAWLDEIGYPCHTSGECQLGKVYILKEWGWERDPEPLEESQTLDPEQAQD